MTDSQVPAEHPGVILDAPLFFGIELEGPRKGMPTIFVKGTETPLLDICYAIDKYEAKQVYFGSGRLSEWSVEQVVTLLTMQDRKDLLATIEVGARMDGDLLALASILNSLPPEVLSRCLFVVTLLMMLPDFTMHSAYHGNMISAGVLLQQFPGNVVLKLDVGTVVHVLGPNESFTNGFSDYSQDVRVTLD